MDVDDEETVALAAAIRLPWSPMPAQAYEPAPPPPPPAPVYVVHHPVPVAAVPQCEPGIAYLLWFFFGTLGVHHFYLGHVVRGLLYLFTGGFLGVGLLVDLFLIPSMTRRRNAELLERHLALHGYWQPPYPVAPYPLAPYPLGAYPPVVAYPASAPPVAGYPLGAMPR